jgi:hypothetical protein
LVTNDFSTVVAIIEKGRRLLANLRMLSASELFGASPRSP